MANIIDSYSETNRDNVFSIPTATRTAIAQSFLCTNAVSLDKAIFYLQGKALSSGTLVAKLYAHSGSMGSSSIPTGSVLATSSSINASSLDTTGYNLVTFTFPDVERVPLLASTNYCIALEAVGGSTSNNTNVGCDGSSTSHSGNAADFTGSWTAFNTFDFCFYVYGFIPSTANHTYLIQGFQ